MISEAIVLAGGVGTRLQSVVHTVPKPMAPILGNPFLQILLETFFQKGITHFILSLGYKSDYIIDYFRKTCHSNSSGSSAESSTIGSTTDNFAGKPKKSQNSQPKISFSVEKKKLDTGGAIRLALTKAKTDYILILNGDTLFDVNLDSAKKIFAQRKSPIIFGRMVDDVARYGEIKHKQSLILGYAEKSKDHVNLTGNTIPTEKSIPHAGIINAGIYVMPKQQLDDFPLHQSFSLEKDYFSKLTPADGFRLIVSNDYFIDIGIPADYQKAQKELRPYVQKLMGIESPFSLS